MRKECNDALSTADKLVALLRKQSDISFIEYRGSYNMAKQQLTVWKRNKKNMHLVTQEEVQHVDSVTEMDISELIKSLKIGNNQFLIALGWVSQEGVDLHKLFPSVLGIDVKFGVNAEGRQLFCVVGKNSDNKNIPIMNAYLPSQKRWVFNWMIKTVIPGLLDKEALLKTSLICTDNDKYLVGAITDTIFVPSLSKYGTCARKICKWHLVNRNYVKKVSTLCISDQDHLFKNTI